MANSATLTAIFTAQDRVSNVLGNLDKKGNSLTNTFKKVAAAAGAAFSIDRIIRFGTECTKAAVQFESGMKEVFTLLPGISEQSMGKMENQVKSFAKEMGTLTTDTVPALYQAISAGVSQEGAFDFLKIADKAAIGGVTTLETAVDGLSSVVNAYGEANLSASQASDLMFTTVKLGKTTFGELAGSLYNVVPTAVGANVAFRDISAALAAMTAQGVPTSVATTQLRQAIVELSKTGTNTDKIFRQIAGKGFKDFVSEGGNLQEAFQLLEKHAASLNQGVNDMFGSVEAGNAVLSLTGQGTQKFTEAMAAMQISAGATDKAFETMEDGMDRKIQKIKAIWEVAKIDIGGVILDTFMPAFQYVSANMDKIADGVKKAFSVLTTAIKALWKIGPVLILYKVTSSIGRLTTALSDLNITSLGFKVNALSLITTAIVALGVGIYKYWQNAKKADLAAHFGDIALSAQELESVAQRIVRTDAVGKLQQSMEARDGLESLATGIQDTVDTIDRMNWKVSIGLALNETEVGEYQSAITSFISQTQQLLQDKQYSLNLALDVLAGNDETGMRDSINSFYLEYQNTLNGLGKQLQAAVNDGFADGLLTVDEAEVISNIQQQMMDITSSLSTAKFESKLELLSMEFSGADLTPESYQALQNQVQLELESAKKALEENYIEVSSALKVMLDLGADKGGIDQATYDSMIESLQLGLNEKLGEIELDASNFQINTVFDSFRNELGPQVDNVLSSIQEEIDYQMETLEPGEGIDFGRLLISAHSSNELPQVVKDNIKDLFNQMKPSVDDLTALADSYIAMGEDIPANIAQGITNAAALGALTGSTESIYTVIGASLSSEASGHSELLSNLETSFTDVPDSVSRGIISNKDAVSKAGADVLATLKSSLEKKMNATIYVDADIRLRSNAVVNGLLNPSLSGLKVGANARGTLNAEDIFLAGEQGPELIVGAGGSTVFPNRETDRILTALDDRSNISRSPFSIAGQDQTQGYDGYRKEERHIVIELKGSGSLQYNGKVTADDVRGIVDEELRPALISLMMKEILEEGDLAYEF